MAVLRPQRSAVGHDMNALFKVVSNLAVAVNELKAKNNTRNAKLDADAGVTDTNYASLTNATFTDIDTIVPSGG